MSVTWTILRIWQNGALYFPSYNFKQLSPFFFFFGFLQLLERMVEFRKFSHFWNGHRRYPLALNIKGIECIIYYENILLPVSRHIYFLYWIGRAHSQRLGLKTPSNFEITSFLVRIEIIIVTTVIKIKFY